MANEDLKFPRTLTIIGNGFDLAMEAKTSYECFYRCLKDCHDIDNLDSFKEKYVGGFDSKYINDFYNFVKKESNNYFLNYFLNYEKIFGDWVSFEKELTKIISSFDSLITHLNTREDYLIYFSNGSAGLYLRILDEVDLMSVINVFSDNKFFKSGVRAAAWVNTKPSVVYFEIKNATYKNEYDIYKAISDFTESFPKRLFGDLSAFSKAFVLYLLLSKGISNNSIAFGQMLDSDYFITYNYTHFLQTKIVDSGCKPLEVFYINGKIDYGKKDYDNKIVFGVDSNTKLNNAFFEVFTKAVQRSLYDTDVQKLSRLFNEDIAKIFIFGHSMNLADYESLEYVFSSSERHGKPEIVVYCYDEQTKIDIIINLKKILGDKRYYEYQRENRLSFPLSRTTIIKKEKI